MAIYRFDSSNSKTHNTAAHDHADYIKREGKYSPEYQKEKDEILKNSYEDLVFKGDFNMPEFGKENSTLFWVASEEFERANGRTYSQFEISLPHELNDEENTKLIKDFATETFENKFPYTLAIHRKPSSKKDVNNIHAHIMFCERGLDGIERNPIHFFKRANPINPELGGCKKDRKWHDINMLKTYRKNWENFLNKELEKRNLEKVSCETLVKQKLEAEKNGDLLKAELLDREPVNINGYILIKIGKSGIDSLSKWEQEELENFKKVKEFKEFKEQVYKTKLSQEQSIVLDFSVEKNKYEFRQNEYIELEVVLYHCEKTIEETKENLLPENLERNVLNILTNNTYKEKFEEINYYKNRPMSLYKEESLLQYKKEYADIKNKYVVNRTPTKEYTNAYNSIVEKYNNIITDNTEHISKINSFKDNNKAMFEKTTDVVVLNNFLEKSLLNKGIIQNKKDQYSKAKKHLEKELSNLNSYALNKATKGEYFKLLKDKELGERTYEKLKEIKENTNSFNVIEKVKLNSKLNDIHKKEKKLTDQINKLKNNIDFSVELISLEKTLATSLDNISNKEKDYTNQLTFEKDKYNLIERKLLEFKNKEFKTLKENIYKATLSQEINFKNLSSEINKSEFKQNEVIELEATLVHCEKALEKSIENLLPENLKRIVLNSLSDNEYQKNINIETDLKKLSSSPEIKEQIHQAGNKYVNIRDTYIPNNKPTEEYTKAMNSILEKYDSIIKTNTEKIDIIKKIKEDHKYIFDTPLNIDSLDKVKGQTLTKQNDLQSKKELYHDARVNLEKELSNLDYYALNKATKGEYANLINKREIANNEYWKLSKEKDKTLSIRFIKITNTNIEMDKLSKKYYTLDLKIKEIKESVDCSIERNSLEKTLNKSINKLKKDEKEYNNQLTFEKEKLTIVEEKLLIINSSKEEHTTTQIYIDINNNMKENDLLHALKQEAKKEQIEHNINRLKEILGDREAIEAKVLDKITNGDYTKNYQIYKTRGTSLDKQEELKTYFENFEKGNLKILINKKIENQEKFYTGELMKLEIERKEQKYNYNLNDLKKLSSENKSKYSSIFETSLSKEIDVLKSKAQNIKNSLSTTQNIKEKVTLTKELKEITKKLNITTNTLWQNRILLRGEKKNDMSNTKSHSNLRQPKKYTAGMRITDQDIFDSENLSDKWNKKSQGMER